MKKATKSDKKSEKSKITVRRITVFVFLVFLTVMTIISLYLPLRVSYSELEQRNLTKFPKVTFVGLLNGDFFDGINTWFADTFPFRENFIMLSTKIENFYGLTGSQVVGDVAQSDDIPDVSKAESSTADESQTVATADESDNQTANADSSVAVPASIDASEDVSATADNSVNADVSADISADASVTTDEQVNTSKIDGQTNDSNDAKLSDAETLGALLVIDNSAYEYYNFVKDTADDYVNAISAAAKKVDGMANVYNIIVPSSMDICVSEKVRSKIDTSNQSDAIDYMYSKMSEKVNTVEIYDTLKRKEEDGEYLYFRTDHHWTAIGAYYGYLELAAKAGFTAPDLSEFKEDIFEGFTGSFYRETKSQQLADTPDTVYAYSPKNIKKITVYRDGDNKSKVNLICDASDYAASNKYLAFIGGDNPFTVIENPDISDGSSVLLVKESYGNCFAPYLAASYQHTYVVDYRYINKYSDKSLYDFVKKYDIQNVVFLNNISMTREDSLVDKLSAFIKGAK